MELLLILLAFVLGAVLTFYYLRLIKPPLPEPINYKQELEQRAYQAEILRELSERIGYSLDVAKIIEIITGSLGKLLDYHTVSYLIQTKDRLVFKCNIRESVNHAFIADVRGKMLAAFSAMLNRELDPNDVDESLTGAILDESLKAVVNSYFNIPLIINSEVVGLITVASPKPNLYTEQQTAILYTITAQASTAVTKLAQVLESEKGKLNALVTSLTDGIVMVDPSWNLLVINPRTRALLALPEGPITMLDVLSKLSGKIDLRTKIEEAIKNDTTVMVPDVAADTPSTNPLRLQIFLSPVKDKDGEPLGAVIVFHNITQEKAVEKMREEFTAMMIHDLRSPLNNIRGVSDGLLRDARTSQAKEISEAITTIRNQVTDMLTLVNDLLDVAKLESGKFTISKESTDLGSLVKEIVSRYGAQAMEKKLQINSDLQGDLKDISLDGFRIRQVLTNLLTNAIKFTDTGGIIIRVVKSDKEVTVSVIDTGIGIPKDDLGLLFTKFQQLRQSSARHEGTGLGLVIARGIVEAHGGKIWAESEVGAGTTFTFTLPT